MLHSLPTSVSKENHRMPFYMCYKWVCIVLPPYIQTSMLKNNREAISQI